MELLLDRVAFTIFGFDVYWYGLIIACAILVAFCLSFILTKPKGLSKDMPIDVFLAIVPLGIICARLFSVIFDSQTTILDFFKFRDGGMSIIGAILGGVIGILILCKIKKYKFLQVSDLIVPVLILAQAIGRWGNFANGEVYGWVINNPSFQFFPIAVDISGTWHMALFFYEFVFNILGAVMLFLLYYKTKKTGICTGAYLVYYGIVRLVLETFRDSQFILRLWGLPISQIISGIFIIVGIIILILVNKKEKKNER
ncbi:MAG: prolipoprotein diacylglyceryl transferase [bacterium]|nr:prolipoprotein diacylglyceryl transferase [bacterium]